MYGRNYSADFHRSAPDPRLLYREAERMRYRQTEESGEERDGGVAVEILF